MHVSVLWVFLGVCIPILSIVEACSGKGAGESTTEAGEDTTHQKGGNANGDGTADADTSILTRPRKSENNENVKKSPPKPVVGQGNKTIDTETTTEKGNVQTVPPGGKVTVTIITMDNSKPEGQNLIKGVNIEMLEPSKQKGETDAAGKMKLPKVKEGTKIKLRAKKDEYITEVFTYTATNKAEQDYQIFMMKMTSDKGMVYTITMNWNQQNRDSGRKDVDLHADEFADKNFKKILCNVFWFKIPSYCQYDDKIWCGCPHTGSKIQMEVDNVRWGRGSPETIAWGSKEDKYYAVYLVDYSEKSCIEMENCGSYKPNGYHLELSNAVVKLYDQQTPNTPLKVFEIQNAIDGTGAKKNIAFWFIGCFYGKNLKGFQEVNKLYPWDGSQNVQLMPKKYAQEECKNIKET